MKKTLTFAGLHFTVAFSLAYLLTGDIMTGGLIALIEPMINTVAFYFHDKVWQNKQAQQKTNAPSLYQTLSFASLHFSIAFSVGYLLSGSLFTGGLLAILEPSVNSIVFYFHEKFWLNKEKASFTLHCHHGAIKQKSKALIEDQVIAIQKPIQFTSSMMEKEA